MAYNILIVDDSSIIRAVVIKTLELTGVPVNKIFQAENGKVGLEVLHNNWIDLAFVDINMPVMGGVAMIEEMFKDDLLHTVPVVVVSTEGSKTRINELIEKGIKGYLRKPFQPEALRDIIDQSLGVQKDEE
ncbi:MAG: response regulator [Nitrospirae bacterium]|nr:response regulator [Nitrospirota bacterium]